MDKRGSFALRELSYKTKLIPAYKNRMAGFQEDTHKLFKKNNVDDYEQCTIIPKLHMNLLHQLSTKRYICHTRNEFFSSTHHAEQQLLLLLGLVQP